MQQLLAEATKREKVAREAPTPAEREREAEARRPLAGAALARECWLAARYAGSSAGISADEIDALAQMVAERAIRATERRATYRPRPKLGAGQHKRPPLPGTGAAPNARALLAFIARAERLPTIAEREIAQVERGQTGKDHLRQIAAGLLRDSREWRDLAETHRRREREKVASVGADGSLSWSERTPAVVTSADPLAPGFLALAERREREQRGEDWVAPIRADHADLAHALTAELAQVRELAPAERRRVWAALMLDLCGAPLAAVAGECGWSLASVSVQAVAGRATLRECWAPADLARVLRECALGLGLAERVTLDRPDLSPAERDARSACEQVRRYAGRWSGPRPSVAPEAWRPTRARSVLAHIDLVSERVSVREWRAAPAERVSGAGRMARLAPDTTRADLAARMARAERARVASAARRAYFATHPLGWSEQGAAEAERSALAAL